MLVPVPLADVGAAMETIERQATELAQGLNPSCDEVLPTLVLPPRHLATPRTNARSGAKLAHRESRTFRGEVGGRPLDCAEQPGAGINPIASDCRRGDAEALRRVGGLRVPSIARARLTRERRSIARS